ncbi:MAG: shikimate dehydrogenase [Pseudoruegeria sp.]
MSEKDIPLAGVIGHPIAHSKSPVLHGHWLRRYGLAGHYIPMNVSRDNLKTVIETLPKMGFSGVNVTLPHKEAMIGLADVITDRAALIGAANTIIFRKDGKIQADNTDGYGFIENLKQGAPDWHADAGPAIVLGAGGASRAIVVSLIDAGAPEILISNRTKSRAEALREEFGAKLRVVDWTQIGSVISDAATLVNTTTQGMIGNPDLRLPYEGLRPSCVVSDIVYTPLQTGLLEEATKVGCVTVDGLGMLLHQAVPGFERWFGTRPEVDDALRAAVLSA